MNVSPEYSVCIGITSFNAESTIIEAIESAQSQTISIEQIIIVDDCSSDNTFKLIKDYVGLSPNFTIIRHSVNRGVSAARNAIIKNSKSEFLAFFDDDDESHPERVKKQIDKIVDFESNFHDEIDVVCHTARIQNYPDGRINYVAAMGDQEDESIPHGMAVFRKTMLGEPLINSNGACATCSQLARLRVYKKVNGFDENLRRCEDFDFAMKLAIAGGYFVGITDSLVTQKMTATVDKNLNEIEKYTYLAYQNHKKKFSNIEEYECCISWLYIKFRWLEGKKIETIQSLLSLILRKPRFTLKRILISLPNLKSNIYFKKFSKN